ncbi:magnesium transporter [Candidatus Similichlamydia laticola]|uniref:Mg/Co/Ni transporter MgtE n=1 Tax=Candidatus Similichlamydia laticola TaxID=2170265 RepID=A0A369KF17_9BACT|nr:magnesium transporter [Candidatus Similichlamydia laticola]RDB31487.1 Mg/Co/Ni transporter MgtE [Candidatus Similichlamydia laticola]
MKETDSEIIPERGHLVPKSYTARDSLLYEKLSYIFSLSSQTRFWDELHLLCSQSSPEDLAHVAQGCTSEQRVYLYEALSNFEDQVKFFASSGKSTKKAVATTLDDDEIAEIIMHLPVDEALLIIEAIPYGRDRRVMALLEPKKAAAISAQRGYVPGTAGRLMSREFFAFQANQTIGDASVFIREHPEIDFLRRVFILAQKGNLKGFVPSRALLIYPMNMPLKRVTKPISQAVGPDSPLEEIVEIFDRYKSTDLPVIDEEGCLLGVITYEDMLDSIEERADKTIAHISGTGEEIEGDVPLFKGVLSRAPWLAITLCAGLLNAGNLSRFPVKYRILLHFVPMINGMSGNVGLQCSTVLVRGIAAGLVPERSTLPVILRETAIGASAGILFGCCGGLLIMLLQAVFGIYGSIAIHPWELGLVVSIGLSGACLFATTLGVLFPLLFQKIGVDPAVASGPIVTAINDVSSTAMYFFVAQLMVRLLFG